MGIVTDLSDFLLARWGEEEDVSVLFHEDACPASRQSGGGQACACACPALIRERIATYRRILADCEQRIRSEQQQGVVWPLESALAYQTMKAFALPFEMHPAFQERWYP
ncbi:hypothetical protein DI272_01550 [Streptomyces sp. Act143]|uniref:DUF6221 family protein n=1 Tax=Streptomyces sp. Act143 TaxID=2200760 RepID=UPI000D682F7D|nr:DUF6221 family protein [Streptomyces sp. Act143]PWI12966.1 hypothetical protein DI272_01550 [Streptomyces sp. Act143]